ncbi:MAG: 23S rRNA (pseudouridine(1915)-N(3))-methyltransferase RlmH [Clostridia bacterium]|nr:23S rRNA (pseudouridine(1915)-N(3))-methyltransferase RlmH [Clostridia bacterium]
MIKISVIAVGRIKERAFCDAADEYKKRLSTFCEISITEIKPYPLPDNPSQAQIVSALEFEAERIIAKIPKGAAVFPLCVEGECVSSEELAKELGTLKNEGRNICFIIGGSYGLGNKVKLSGKNLSFSKMTFPHRLFRVMLLEQIYRAFTIISGKTYHK